MLNCVDELSALTATLGITTGGNSVEAAYAAAWDGNRWSTEPVASPGEAVTTLLTALSCTTSGVCTAIGFSATAGRLTQLTETRVEHSWQPLWRQCRQQRASA